MKKNDTEIYESEPTEIDVSGLTKRYIVRFNLSEEVDKAMGKLTKLVSPDFDPTEILIARQKVEFIVKLEGPIERWPTEYVVDYTGNSGIGLYVRDNQLFIKQQRNIEENNNLNLH